MKYVIGIDVSDLTFTASCATAPASYQFEGHTFEQTEQGWKSLLALMEKHQVPNAQTAVCMEATGVYSERISHFLHGQGFPVYVEPPRVISRAFYEKEKTDPVDSRQIAEYPFRYPDRVHLWQPPNEIIDQLKTLLTARELVIKNRTACKNTSRSLTRKHYQPTETQSIYETLIEEHGAALKHIDAEMRRIIDTNPVMSRHMAHILTIKSVGFLLAVNLAVVTNGFTEHIKYQSLAKFIGIYPIIYQSGTSVYRRPAADGAGSARLRKLLYLAAMRLKRKNAPFETYYARKLAEGKSGKLVLNNIANKALKLICGVIKSGKPYVKGYTSTKP